MTKEFLQHVAINVLIKVWSNKTFLLNFIIVFQDKPISNPTYVSGPNGCGTYNIIIDFSSFNLNEFTLCCNSHDTCFGTCNSGKNNCDSSFKTCLDNFCNQKFGNSFRNFFKKISKIFFVNKT